MSENTAHPNPQKTAAGDTHVEATPQPNTVSAIDQTAQLPASGISTPSAPSLGASAEEREVLCLLTPSQVAGDLGRLGSYRVLRILGSGGMGVVFYAEDPQLGRAVALKVMRPSMAASELARVRFMREAQTTAALEHDNIVPIYQVAEDQGVPFLVMRLLKGESLDDRLKRETRLPLAEALRIGRETAEGLAAAHKNGLIHRDIKPSNIWLEEGRGRVVLLDFGLAKPVSQDVHLTQEGTIVGTPAYMAPEQARGAAVDARADLFALGAVLYRISCGVPPFSGASLMDTMMAVMQQQPKPPHEVVPGLPRPLSDLIMRLLAKDAADRPELATKVAEMLRAIEKGQDVSSDRTAATPPPPSSRRRIWPFVAVGAVASLLLAGFLFRDKLFDTREDQKVEKKEDDKEPPPEPEIQGEIPTPKPVLPIPEGRVALDALNRKDIPPEALAAAGGGDAAEAHAAIVAVWGRKEGKSSGTPHAVAFSPDGSVLACGVLDGSVHLFNGATGNWRHSFQAHLNSAVRHIVFSPDNTMLATAGATDGMVYLRDAATRKKLRAFPSKPGDTRRMAFTPDGKVLATGSNGASGSKVTLHLIRPGTTLPSLKESRFKVTALAISPDGKWLAAASSDAEGAFVKLWDLTTGEVASKPTTGAAARTLVPFGRAATSLAFSPDSKKLAASFAFYNVIREWNFLTAEPPHDLERTPKTHSQRVPQKVLFGLDTKTMISVTDGSTICVWDGTKKTGRHTFRFDPPVKVIHDFALSPEGRHLVTANSDGTLYVLRLKP